MVERNVPSVLKEQMHTCKDFFFSLISLSTCGAKGKGKETLKSQ